jgi:arylsulfatase A-like enzyme
MLRGLLALLLLTAAAPGCEAPEASGAEAGEPSARPNIILVVAEDMGPRLGAYGDAVAHTPNLDRLAREGTRFTQAFTTAGVCAPSRAAIITGLHQNVWGAGHMRAAGGGYAASPPDYVKAFPELLRAAGYYTVNNGKTDYQMGMSLGGAYGGPETLWDEDDSLDWRGRAPGQPFFAYLNLMQTHESQVWPTWMLPDGWLPLVLWPIRILNHLQWPVQTDPARVSLPPYYADTETARADVARHYNNIAAMDAAVGELLDQLDEQALRRNTIVIFTSDHGDGFPRAKRWLYDSGIRVPLIVRWPGTIEPESVSDRLVSAVDLAPTILAMAGVAPPEWLHGRVFAGPDEGPEEQYVFAARDRIDDQPDTVRAVRDVRFKYIRHFRPELPYLLESNFRDQMPMMRELRVLHEAGKLSATAELWFRKTRDREELFDLASDPHEVNNLAGDSRYREELVRMRVSLDDWLARHEDLGLVPEEQLRVRFFPAGEQPVTPAPVLKLEDGAVHARPGTPGASIELRHGDGPWRLYRAPVSAASGQEISARSQRYGWKMSKVVKLE